MSKHTERAKELRSEVPVSSNCAQTVMRVYAKEIESGWMKIWQQQLAVTLAVE